MYRLIEVYVSKSPSPLWERGTCGNGDLLLKLENVIGLRKGKALGYRPFERAQRRFLHSHQHAFD